MEHNVNLDVNTEKVETLVEKVKVHLKKNQQTYLTGAGCLFVGLTLGRTAPRINVAPIMNNVQNNIVVNALGDPGNVVKCCETGTIYASQGQAARELGISTANLSKHLNGMREAVDGLTFEVLGKAGHPLA